MLLVNICDFLQKEFSIKVTEIRTIRTFNILKKYALEILIFQTLSFKKEYKTKNKEKMELIF